MGRSFTVKVLGIVMILMISIVMILVTLAAFDNNQELRNKGEKFTNYTIINIEGCEYIQYATSYNMLEITHKGNCTNEIHNCK
jgi:hypothetical protein